MIPTRATSGVTRLFRVASIIAALLLAAAPSIHAAGDWTNLTRIFGGFVGSTIGSAEAWLATGFHSGYRTYLPLVLSGH